MCFPVSPEKARDLNAGPRPHLFTAPVPNKHHHAGHPCATSRYIMEPDNRPLSGDPGLCVPNGPLSIYSSPLHPPQS